MHRDQQLQPRLRRTTVSRPPVMLANSDSGIEIFVESDAVETGTMYTNMSNSCMSISAERRAARYCEVARTHESLNLPRALPCGSRGCPRCPRGWYLSLEKPKRSMRWLSIFAASGQAPSMKSMSHSASISPTLLEDRKIVHAALVRNVIARMTARCDYKASIHQCRRSGVAGANPSPRRARCQRGETCPQPTNNSTSR
jgi:hypothetical protein